MSEADCTTAAEGLDPSGNDVRLSAKSGPCHKNVNLCDLACSVLHLAHSLATSITRNLFADKPDEGYS